MTSDGLEMGDKLGLGWNTLRRSQMSVPEDVVEGLIPGSSLVMFSGDGGIGKSYVLLEMALHVALGMPWLGMQTTQTPVLIIDLENRKWRDALRVKHISAGQCLENGTEPPVAIETSLNISFDVDDDVDWFHGLIERHSFGLVILDSLVDFINPTMARVCKRLRSIIDATGATILAIHHAPKSSSGASTLKNNSDCSIQVIRSGGGTGDILTMRHDKARDFTYKYVKCNLNWNDRYGTFSTRLLSAGDAKDSQSGDDDEQAILDCLATEWRKRSEVTEEAMRATGKQQATISTKITRLIERDRIIEDASMFGCSTGIRIYN